MSIQATFQKNKDIGHHIPSIKNKQNLFRISWDVKLLLPSVKPDVGKGDPQEAKTNGIIIATG